MNDYQRCDQCKRYKPIFTSVSTPGTCNWPIPSWLRDFLKRIAEGYAPREKTTPQVNGDDGAGCPCYEAIKESSDA